MGKSTISIQVMILTTLFTVGAIIALTISWRISTGVFNPVCFTTAKSNIENLCITDVEKYTGQCRFPKTGAVEVQNCIKKIVFFSREDLKTVLRENDLEDVKTGCVENVRAYVLIIPRPGIQGADTPDKIKEALNEHISCTPIKNAKFSERVELFGPEGDKPKVYCVTVDLGLGGEQREYQLTYEYVAAKGECI